MTIPVENTAERHGWLAMTFHWTMAFAIPAMLGLGLYMDGLPDAPKKFELYGIHKAIGSILLGLVVVRFCWRLANRVPRLPAHVPHWQARIARLTHGLLYAALFAMPMTGWIMSSAAGFPVSVFGWFTLPDLVAPDKALAERFATAHGWIAWGLIGLIALHVAAALKHHFLDRDGVLKGMLPCDPA